MGLLNPSALIFSGLFAVLVLLYLWERRRFQIDVPSLLLWQAVAEDRVQARRFRPDAMFLLQLLLLAALIAGLARPYLRSSAATAPGRRHLFILDTSASMQTREGGTTRFEAARAALRQRIAALPAADEAMLMTAAARPEIVADFTRDHARLSTQLDALHSTDTGTNLELALAVATGAAQRTDTDTSVEVFTDMTASQLPERWRVEADRGELELIRFGDTDANLAITGLQLFQSRFQEPRDASAYVVVQNFAHREGHGVLTVLLNDTTVMQAGFTLAAGDARAFSLARFEGPGRVTARLDAQDDGEDALAVDNIAIGWIHPMVPVRVILVSADTPLVRELETVVSATPGLHLLTVTPEAYDPSLTAGADLVIFHRFAPSTQPAIASLYISPPAGDAFIPVSAEVQDVEILDWNEHHPVVGSLRPVAALPIRRAQVVLPTEWQVPLLLSRTLEREFPLAFAGEVNGRRVGVIAFDLEAERLLSSDNVSFLLFLLNFVGWLAPATDDITTVITGTVVPVTGLPPVPTRGIDPHGQPLTIDAGSGATIETLLAGEYRIDADGVVRTIYANFFDPTESNIGRSAAAPAPTARGDAKPVRSAAVRAPHGAEFGWWLALAAAGLLTLEWVVSGRRT